MTTLMRHREAVAEAKAAVRDVRDELRAAEAAGTTNDDLREKADNALTELAEAKAALEREERFEAEMGEAHRGFSGASPAPDPVHEAERDALRAVSEALRARLTSMPLPEEAIQVFAQYGVESPIDGNGGVVIPDEMIRAALNEAQRAATGTGNIATHSPLAGSRIYSFMRPMSAMSAMGLTWEPVDMGEPKYAWVNASPDGSAEAEDTDLEPIAPDRAELMEKEFSPRRIVAPRGVTVEAEYSLAQLGEVITNDAYSAVDAASENQMFNGNGTAPNLQGVNGRAEDHNAVNAEADTFASVVADVEGVVDGIYAGAVGDLRILASPACHAFLATLRVSDNSTESAASYLARMAGSYKVSAYAPAATDGGKVHHLLVRRGMHAGAVAAPSWGMRLYLDDMSAAGVGRKLIVVRLANLFVPQSAKAQGKRADWRKVAVRSAA